jgi:hypothetical protein
VDGSGAACENPVDEVARLTTRRQQVPVGSRGFAPPPSGGFALDSLTSSRLVGQHLDMALGNDFITQWRRVHPTGPMTAVPARGRTVVAMDPMAGGRIMSTVDVNRYGTVHGGVIMKLVDDAAGASAARHSGGNAVTASMDEMQFLWPVRVGDLVHASAQVNWTGRTSTNAASARR